MREREVRDDGERLARKRDPGRVALDDAHVRVHATAKRRGERRVDLHRDDARACAPQREREHPRARAEVQHEIARADAGVADELLCEGSATKRVPAAR